MKKPLKTAQYFTACNRAESFIQEMKFYHLIFWFVKIIIFLIEEEYHGRFFFARDLTERDRDMTREVKVFIDW